MYDISWGYDNVHGGVGHEDKNVTSCSILHFRFLQLLTLGLRKEFLNNYIYERLERETE